MIHAIHLVLFIFISALAVWNISATVAMPQTYSSHGQKADENLWIWAGGSSYIRLMPVEGKDHVAEVEFSNQSVHADRIETDSLSIGGLSIGFTADVGHGNRPDFLDVEVPDGFVAVPFGIAVPENETGRILIYRAKEAPAM